MSKITDIIHEYAGGTKTLDEANEALREAGAGFSIKPDKQQITPEEMMQGDQRNGFGLLDTGTGSFDKVEVKDMQLVVHDASCAGGLFKFNGKWYSVAEDGKTLSEVV